MATAPQPARPARPAQRMSSGKDILSRMLQMEKQSKVDQSLLGICEHVCRGTALANPCLLSFFSHSKRTEQVFFSNNDPHPKVPPFRFRKRGHLSLNPLIYLRPYLKRYQSLLWPRLQHHNAPLSCHARKLYLRYQQTQELRESQCHLWHH